VFASTYGTRVHDFYLESNTGVSVLTACLDLTLDGVFAGSPSTDVLSLVGCNGTHIRDTSASITVDSTSTGTVIDGWVNNGGSITNSSSSTIFRQGAHIIGQTNHLDDPVGMPAAEQIFSNPWMAIWPSGASSAPLGFESSTNATFARNTSTISGGNRLGTSVAVTATGTAVSEGVNMRPAAHYAVLTSARWVAPLLDVYVATGQPNLRVFLFQGSSYVLMDTVTTKDTWVSVRGPVLVPGSGDWYIAIRPWNGSAYVAGNYFVGGLSVVNGTVSPQHLFDTGRHDEFIARQVSADYGDAAATLQVGISPRVARWSTTLTADRQATLSLTGATTGDRFDVRRSAAGAFNLTLADATAGAFKTMPASSWATCVFNGTAWELLAYGAL
jgi:hypothetical protein